MWVSRQYCVKHYYAKWIINHLFQFMSTTCQMQIPKVPDAEKQNKKPQSVENVPIYTIIHQTSYFH